MVHVVAGPRVSAPIDEGFALALTSGGEVYSWGRGFGGRHICALEGGGGGEGRGGGGEEREEACGNCDD